jgi:hypothetical protein
MKRIKWINGLILAAVWLGSAGWGQAAPTFTVNSTADVAVVSGALDNGICETATGNGICTLRAAIIKANHWPGGGITINLPALPTGGKYSLTIPPSGNDDETTGNLNIDQNMNIVGGGATNTVIEGNSVASIVGGVIVIIGVPVNLSGVSIQKGTANAGGGIVVENALTLTNSSVSGNSASNGGGIYNKGGQLTIINSTVSSNLVVIEGGGIFNSGTLTIINSTISGNSSGSNGGGIHSGNNLTIINSTISGNSAAANGGGINNVGTLAIANSSTITQNLADTDFNGIGTGGGIFNLSGSSLTFKNTIIANNGESAFAGSIVAVRGDCAGTLISQGFNIVSTPNAQCTIIGPFSQVNPLLGPLQNNGGPTQTHALLNGSPAIDAGEIPNCTDNLGAPIITDQRGLHRPANGGISLRCDIGAFEFGFELFLPLIKH